MATTYTKLNPPLGDAFSSKELGLYLVPGNASEIDQSILYNRLVQFILTGFLVEISKLEYDNIKLLNSTTSNVPLNSVPIGQPYILEPVEDVVNAPIDSNIGKRYLVPQNVPGIWMSRKDYIAQSDGQDWIYTKPENGMILPIYAWGISLHYTGTYPSGSWDIPQERLDALNGSGTSDDTQLQQVLDLLAQETSARINGDSNLQQQITNLPQPGQGFSGKAADVSILDTNNYFTSGSVEGALQQIGATDVAQQGTINFLSEAITEIQANGGNFQFLYGDTIPDVGMGNLRDIYIDSLTGIIYKKNGTSNEDAIWISIYAPPNSTPAEKYYGVATPLPIVIDYTGYASIYGKWPDILVKYVSGKDITSQAEIDCGLQYDVGTSTSVAPTTITINVDADLDDPTVTGNAIIIIIKS